MDNAFSRMLKRFWRPKTHLPASVKYPLALEAGQVAALREWVASPAYKAYQRVVSELAQHCLTRLLSTEPNKVEYERGALASLTQCYDVVTQLLATCEAIDDRTRSNGSKRHDRNAYLLGHPLWRPDSD